MSRLESTSPRLRRFGGGGPSRTTGSSPITLPRSTEGPTWLQPRFVAVLAVVLAITLSYLALTSAVASAGYDLANLQDQSRRLRRENAQTRLEIDRLRSLDRIARVASGLGLEPPERTVFVVTIQPDPGHPTAGRADPGGDRPGLVGALVRALHALLNSAGPG